VVGATLGAATAVPGCFKRIREICDRYDVLAALKLHRRIKVEAMRRDAGNASTRPAAT